MSLRYTAMAVVVLLVVAVMVAWRTLASGYKLRD